MRNLHFYQQRRFDFEPQPFIETDEQILRNGIKHLEKEESSSISDPKIIWHSTVDFEV